MKLRNENRELEEKLRESLSNVQHRGEVCKQLKDDLKQTTAKVSTDTANIDCSENFHSLLMTLFNVVIMEKCCIKKPP